MYEALSYIYLNSPLMQGVDPNANNIVGAAKMKLANGGGEADCFSVVRLEMQVEQELAGTQFT